MSSFSSKFKGEHPSQPPHTLPLKCVWQPWTVYLSSISRDLRAPEPRSGQSKAPGLLSLPLSQKLEKGR